MIRFEEVSMEYGSGVRALDRVSVSFPGGGTTCLVGASGSGKSTLLRLVNRLVEPRLGRVLLDGQDVRTRDAVALRRRIGYCVQGGGLLPHLTVAENVGLVPRLLDWTPQRTSAAVDRTLRLTRLDPVRYGGRRPAALSGGERQRAGIARALAAEPDVLLLDEPLGALDPHLRETLEDDLRDLFRSLRMTVVFVTHDMHTAVRLGDRLAVLDAGRLQQFGSPRDIVTAPATDAVAALLGRRRSDLERSLSEMA